ncbi:MULTISPECIES: rhodanese-like domain-containing protein [Streptomycetaceae]|uniref:Rhodanese domain protein n=1 Tax=Streptantibioticus cattleyicolor (strain ATCC 35852 / DSM 46488 / JCM 4925 / NBRC 14057 / NRRL 8057) TaxID=1003195 RepID=F8JSC2_STREN|nr:MULTISPECIES: rhodanese-like domain-containing protein [Streptomycetaceae]AEW95436.1 Rhodanese domain protein [Streptantibioticus cattleyicolor NRRL 8057 = DSM 46488]MYS60005.1 rhodanese-like domain-containing protein [Streptomyces sp. SID5468]CCB75779.1 Rhodanese domain-containing protein [Streptantibioticus cattleyicolor NRRL 8057 = DSM 46488]
MNFAPLPEVAPAAVPSDGYLLDVREADEWAAGHAERAVHIPMSELVARIAEIPTDRRVHVVCRVGGRSAQVAQYLIAQGYDAVNVAGGMLDWAASGLPLTTDDDTPATIV